MNLENDIIGKYVEKLMLSYGKTGGDPAADTDDAGGSGSGLTLEFLMENGF